MVVSCPFSDFMRLYNFKQTDNTKSTEITKVENKISCGLLSLQHWALMHAAFYWI